MLIVLWSKRFLLLNSKYICLKRVINKKVNYENQNLINLINL